MAFSSGVGGGLGGLGGRSSFAWPAVYAFVPTNLLYFSYTTRVLSVWQSLDFCWAFQTQLTSVLDVRLY